MIRATSRAAAMERQRRAGQSVPLPLPFGGWLSEAKAANVSPVYAAVFDNLWSDGMRLTTRPGYAWQDVESRPLDRLPFEFGIAAHHLEVFPDRLTGAVGSFTRATTGRWMAAPISERLLLAGGGGAPLVYDGATPAAAGFTIAAGVTPADLVGVVTHRDRPYFWPRSALEFYYGATVGAITGALTRFPLGRLGNISGHIATMGSISFDAGDRAQDMLLIATTTGDVVIYAGDDPSSVESWRIVSRLKVAPPIGRFAIVNRGSDALLWTTEGVVSIRDALSGAETAVTRALTRQIATPMRDRAAAAQTPDLWTLTKDPAGACLLATIVEPTGVEILAYGFEARMWSRWTGLPVRTWSTLGSRLTFTGLDGRLAELARPGVESAMGDDGDPIAAALNTAWFRIGRGGFLAGLSPAMTAQGPLTLSLTALADGRDSAADVAEAAQKIVIDPERDGAAHLSDDLIPVGQAGGRFQLRLAFSAAWAEITSLDAQMG